jgi:hypothetical protein
MEENDDTETQAERLVYQKDAIFLFGIKLR